MSAENWIEILNRAIQMNADWEVEDEPSGQTFIYDAEALNDIVTLLESGSTSDEIVHQYGEYVGSDFERYIETLEQAMEEAGEDAHESPEEQAPVVEDTVDSGGHHDVSEADVDEFEENESAAAPQTKPTQKNKKVLVVGSAVAGLLLMLVAGGFVFYSAFTQTSAPVAQDRSVSPVLKSTPKPPVEEPNQQQVAPADNQTSEPPIRDKQRRETDRQNYTVAQMGSSSNQGSGSNFSNQATQSAPVIQSTAQARPSNPSPSAAMDDTELAEIRNDLNDQIEKFEESMTADIGDRIGGLRETLGRMEEQLKRIDELEKKLAQESNEKNKQSETVNRKVKGLTRLGEFSILANAGVGNRVVALSPTNKVITLEEGERNIIAAGSNLTVEEIVGDGDAVIFSNGWFIDRVRAPESLREQRLTSAAQSSDKKEKTAPEVPRTAAISQSLNPALVASSSRNSSDVDGRFPTIQRAPEGWEATALIPPRRAVIITPEGNSVTITTGSQIAGLGKVHSVKHDRVLAGQFYIPLSNL